MSNYQNHQGGNKFELLTQKIFKIFDIAIDLLDYEEFPELQNAGIDAFINKPDQFKGLSLQIKMFRNVQKYGTFPWEVSRFLTDYNSTLNININLFVIVCYLLSLITIIIVMINLKINYSIIFLGIYFLTLLYQIKIFSLRNPSNCLKAFKINNLSGLMVFLGFFTLAIDML